MEAHEMDLAERPRKGIWYVVGSVPLLSEMLMLVLDRLHRLALGVILLLDVLIIAAAFVCAALLVPRERTMVIGTRHCVKYDYTALPGLDPPPGSNTSWFQSWRIDDDDFVCSRVESSAQESNQVFRNFFIDGKMHTSFQMPLRKNRVLNPFNRANRYMKGYLSIDFDLSDNATRPAGEGATVRLRLGGRDGGGRQPDWDQLGRSVAPLDLDTCELRNEQADDGSAPERCVVNRRLFEVASLDQQYYLLNVVVQNMTQVPLSMKLLIIDQSRLYTLVCLNLQAAFTGLMLLLLALFLVRVRKLYKSAPTGHRLLAALAVALIVWDVPFGYIALDYDMWWLGILDAIRLDLFYLVFLGFCLVFVWEQAFIKDVRRPVRRLLSALSPLLLGCLLLLALDVTQQALQLSDVFSARPEWLRFCLAALLVLNALYVLVLCAAAGRGWRRAGWTGSALPGRYRAAMALTCLTAAAGCVEHAERRESDNWWFWNWTEQRPTDGHLLYIGMVVWYNVYVATLLILYLPTRPLVELAPPAGQYQDELKVPLNGGDDGPEPIQREALQTDRP